MQTVNIKISKKNYMFNNKLIVSFGKIFKNVTYKFQLWMSRLFCVSIFFNIKLFYINNIKIHIVLAYIT